ncbi:MAG: hypothetical protein HRU03_07125, partial [Nanoarchaeales archaeon]|nr:hypothetical protein [Nanoarchaeales archaeon]
IAYDVLTLSNNDLFSVPYGVDYQRMNMEAGLTDGSAIFEYKEGNWTNIEVDGNDNAMFKPLMGYKFQSNTNINLPIYIDENYDISEIKRELDSNFNLIGLNSIYDRIISDYLGTSINFNGLYDDNGNPITTNDLNPTKSYWISVNGIVGENKIFYGVSDGLFNPTQ